MAHEPQVDYDALAAQARQAKPSAPVSKPSAAIDYDALANQARQAKPSPTKPQPFPLEPVPSTARLAWDAITHRQEPGEYFKPPESDTSWKASAEEMADSLLTTLHNVGGRAVEVVGKTIKHPIDSMKGVAQTAKELAWDQPMEMFGGPKDTDGPLVQRIEEFKKDYAVDPKKAVENAAGDVLAMYASGKILDAAGTPLKKIGGKVADTVTTKLAERYGPRTVEIAGEKVPVLVGEAAPDTPAGREQESLKRSGTGATRFKQAEQVQNQKIKDAIRNVAQQTSGMIGPVSEEPGAAMQDAATATFNQAKPLYAALDDELITVPGDFHNASTIVKKAVQRAKSLGYDFEASREGHYGEEPIGTGNKEDRPIQDFMEVRSQLSKMRAGSSDAAFRYRVGEEIKSMTEAMDAALDNTGLKDSWKEADRLWAKGYALREIADTLNSTTKGTPAAEQASELDAIPTEIQGARLVDKLNELRRDGTLARGFSPKEASNLRKAADILQRVQKIPIGRSAGESVSQGRAIAHALKGNVGTLVGAGLGFAVSHTPVGAEGGAALGWIVQRIGERALVNIMTKTDGVKAIEEIGKAKTRAEMGKAISSVLSYASAQSASQQSEEHKAPEAHEAVPQ